MLELAGLLGLFSLIHGISLGAMLMYFSSKKKPSFLLGVFLFLFGVSFLFNVLNDYGIAKDHPELFILPFRFCFLIFPVLYLYVKGLTTELSIRKDFKHIIPGIMEFLLLTFLFFYIPNEAKKDFYYGNGFTYTFAANIYTAYYLIRIIRLLKRNNKEINEFYSAIDDKILNWLKPIIVCFLILIALDYLLLGAQYFALNIKGIRKPLMIIYVVQNGIYTLFTYWIAFFGMKQHNFSISPTQDSKPLTSSVKTVNTEGYDDIYKDVTNYIMNTQCYTNDELTIVDLANELDLHYRKLSKIINHKADCTFNNFINKYRVEEAKRIMSDPERAGKLTLEVVGLEAGFKSNSSLYSAFRKFEGMTPSNFMKG